MSHLPCIVCNRAESAPQHFLLKCCSCNLSYHHICHNPLIQQDQLIALIRATTAVRGGSTDPRDDANSLYKWKCASCKKKPVVIDLSFSDDEDEILEVQKQPDDIVEIPKAKEPAEQEEIQVVNDNAEDVKPQVKFEESRISLQRAAPRNTAPAWIHKQHAESQAPDPWDRLAQKKASRRPRKAASQPTEHQPFTFQASLWLEHRRSAFPV